MSLEEFHRNFRDELHSTVSDRIQEGDGRFPSDELVFAEMVMEHVHDAGICESPTICHWNGSVRNAKLRITGFSISSDETALDLFVTHYSGSDAIEDVRDSDITATANQALQFLFHAADGKLENRIDPTHPVRDLLVTIRSRWNDMDRLRIFVITDGKTKTKRFANKEAKQKIVMVESMDIERLYRHTEGKPRDELAVSFVQSLGHLLPCVYVPDPDADYEYALTAIPGQLIRDLYLRFGFRLLEANVRTFLGSKKPINKGIIETLKREPEHFLAFNNGLVLVCDEAGFDRSDDGSIGLSFLRGLQIVNGGQTTSTLYFSTRDDPTIDLSHVMVPAKIIILKGSQDNLREMLISKVSRFANSQNAVKMSDLSANRPFHIELEKLTNGTWCPDGQSRWFYERASGSYNVMLLRDGVTSAKRRKLRETVPPKRKLTKNDIAKYHEAWRGKPYQVALAGEKNFAAFMSALDAEPTIVPMPLDTRWYKAMIAKVILFKAIESIIKTTESRQTFRQGWVNIATYVVAIVAEKFGNEFDLDSLWQKQGVSPELREMLWDWAIVVNSEFHRIAPGQQISEVAKRMDSWMKIRAADYPAPARAIPELNQRNSGRAQP